MSAEQKLAADVLPDGIQSPTTVGRCPESLVSIILPTYNRSRFLAQAFDSIQSQTFRDWELIVVDDGSTDNTRELVSEFANIAPNRVDYVYQENQGPYAARNVGLNRTRGAFIAFFDSDDCWLPHHLDDCVAALQTNPEVDWVYGASRIVDFDTGSVLAPNAFYVDGRPRPFLKLRTRASGRLRIIEDPTSVRCQILHGLFCGLQTSVFRSRVFSARRFCAEYRNEAEDHVFPVRVLASGGRIAYYDNVHVVYNVHVSNSSASATDRPLSKILEVFQPLSRGLEELRQQVPLTPRELRALDRRLSREYFWSLGYAGFWQHGRRREAIELFRRGLRLWPWNVWYWKTYLFALLRSIGRPGTVYGRGSDPQLRSPRGSSRTSGVRDAGVNQHGRSASKTDR